MLDIRRADENAGPLAAIAMEFRKLFTLTIMVRLPGIVQLYGSRGGSKPGAASRWRGTVLNLCG